MIKIQTVSDLHDDMNKSPISKIVGDHLILAGDVADHPEYWDRYAELDIPVIAVMGNHEFMNKQGSVEDRVQEFKDRFEDSLLSVLYNEILTVDGITYFGTTLWSDTSRIPNTIKDNLEARGASGLTLDEWRKEYLDSVAFLDNMLPSSQGVNVVVSHFSPSFLGESTKYRHSEHSVYFHSNLEYLIKRHQPTLWVHGHIHSPADYYIGSTRILANPRGNIRYQENPSFKEDFTITLHEVL